MFHFARVFACESNLKCYFVIKLFFNILRILRSRMGKTTIIFVMPG